MRDNGLPNQPVSQECKLLLATIKKQKEEGTLSELLTYYRHLDQE